jgi:hypothetical protein
MPVPLDQAGATELTRTTASGSLIDDLAHRQGLAHDVLPDDSRDNPTNADGLAAVMTEGEFIEMGQQVLGANRSGVRAERPALRSNVVQWQPCRTSLSRRSWFVCTTAVWGRSSRLRLLDCPCRFTCGSMQL